MEEKSGARVASRILVVALCGLAMFHVLVMLRVVPGGAVWGGQAVESPGKLVQLEAIGLVVTLLFAFVAAAKGGLVRAPGLRRFVGIGAWVMFGYFVLNTLGNLASHSSLEKAIFTPLSIVLAVLAFCVARERTP